MSSISSQAPPAPPATSFTHENQQPGDNSNSNSNSNSPLSDITNKLYIHTKDTDKGSAKGNIDNVPLVLDLFSGVGGISVALRGFVETLLYCDADKYCQTVLVERMEEGRLDKAPIHPNVKTLHLGAGIVPNMIIGGFPCTDISSIGLQKGIIGGACSSLFYEIVRLVDECPSVEHVFLENVGNILKCGMKEVVDELAQKRGWSMQWTMRSAAMMGAPHQRMRWFCLASKPGTIPLADKYTNYANAAAANANEGKEKEGWWEKEPGPRITFKPHVRPDESWDDCWISRWHCMGNAVVPAAVRDAFIELMRCERHWNGLDVALDPYGRDVTSLGYPYPDAGLVHKGRFYAMPSRVEGCGVAVRDAFSITIRTAMSNGVVNLRTYPTPRRGNTHAAIVTERTIRDLPTILVHCDKSLEYMRAAGVEPEEGQAHAMAIANINYVEWLMGFEKDWTKVGAEYHTKATKTTKEPKVARKKKNAEQEEEEDTTDEVDETIANEEQEANQVEYVSSTNASSDPKINITKKVQASRKGVRNGMHVFMKDNPGNDVKETARRWKELSAETKAEYSARAKSNA
jgi:DNA (cytosine-5)-methyltransferase 1